MTVTSHHQETNHHYTWEKLSRSPVADSNLWMNIVPCCYTKFLGTLFKNEGIFGNCKKRLQACYLLSQPPRKPLHNMGIDKSDVKK